MRFVLTTMMTQTKRSLVILRTCTPFLLCLVLIQKCEAWLPVSTTPIRLFGAVPFWFDDGTQTYRKNNRINPRSPLFSSLPQVSSSLATPNLPQQQQQQEANKREFLDLLPRLMPSDYGSVERFINELEASYTPPQTLAFFHFSVQGTWELLLSTSQLAATTASSTAGYRTPNHFRLKEPRILQRILLDDEGEKKRGSQDTTNSSSTVMNTITTTTSGRITTTVNWELAQEKDAVFDCSGSFAVESTYSMDPPTQGSRMTLSMPPQQNDDANAHILRPSNGSNIPRDVPELVSLLRRAMPQEFFDDPTGHAIDTTYVDATLKIVRYTGSRWEGARDVFLRYPGTTTSQQLNASRIM